MTGDGCRTGSTGPYAADTPRPRVLEGVTAVGSEAMDRHITHPGASREAEDSGVSKLTLIVQDTGASLS